LGGEFRFIIFAHSAKKKTLEQRMVEMTKLKSGNTHFNPKRIAHTQARFRDACALQDLLAVARKKYGDLQVAVVAQTLSFGTLEHFFSPVKTLLSSVPVRIPVFCMDVLSCLACVLNPSSISWFPNSSCATDGV
jgi:hypothetical protein